MTIGGAGPRASLRREAVRAGVAAIVIGAALPQVVLSGYGLFHIGELE